MSYVEVTAKEAIDALIETIPDAERAVLLGLAKARPAGVSLHQWLFKVDRFRFRDIHGSWCTSHRAAITTEKDRMEMARKAAEPPVDCRVNIPTAPARGPMKAFVPRKVVMTEDGPRERSDAHVDEDTSQRLRAARALDAFDEMERQALKAHERLQALARPSERVAFVAPFSIGQIEIGRDYAALSERCAASGVKCASLEALREQGGGGDFTTALLYDFGRLRQFHARIGNGLAKEVRRIRPGTDKRRAIRTRDLVDSVCLGGLTLTQVLMHSGWGVDTKSLRALRTDLSAALDRMRGYDLDRPQDMG